MVTFDQATLVAAFELVVELVEALAVRAARERAGAGRDGAQLEAAQAPQRVERPTRGLAEFAVVDNIDAGLDLAPHDLGDRTAQALVVGARVDLAAILLRARKLQKARGTR